MGTDWITLYPFEGGKGDVFELIVGLSQFIITILELKLIVSSMGIHSAITARDSDRRRSSNSKPKKPWALRLAIIIFCGHLISSLIGIWRCCSYFFGHYKTVFVLIKIHSITQAALVSLLYIFMAFRVQDTFGNTAFEQSKNILILHIINIVGVSVGIFLFDFVLSNINLSASIKMIFIAAVLCPYIVGSAHLIYMFNARLFSLFVTRRRHEATSAMSPANQTLKLLSTVRKQTVLGLFMVMAQIIIAVYGVLLYAVIDIYLVSGYISYWATSIGCVIMESVCLFAGFSENNMYHFLCTPCDRICDVICIQYVERGIQSENMETEMGVSTPTAGAEGQVPVMAELNIEAIASETTTESVQNGDDQFQD